MALADEVHPTFPERRETFAEKRHLFSEGALAWAREPDDRLQGYAFAYPWTIGTLPKLDTFFGALPENADCLYLHDCVVAKTARGQNASGRLIAHLSDIARTHGLHALTLIAVYGSEHVWSRHGFAPVDWPDARAVLAGYGQGAAMMLASL